jgi:hypothetical protein
MDDRNIMVYKHFGPGGKVLTYMVAYDNEKDVLEGIRTENQ